MVRHILLLKQRADATAADIEASRAGLAALVGQIHGLIDFHWGTNFAPAERAGGFTHGFSMDFTDRASLDAYGPHPTHQVAAAKVRATFDAIVVLDIEM
ncbi:MAG TPA: Dabb family protein [Kofleriaceae bacterium]|nr:Dabb family protein [Kofleriaceae bacterium]